MQRSVIVVGGGSAGWMTALWLAVRPGFTVTLVQSPDVPPVGVGEATVPSLRAFLATCGLPEERWMPEADATYKLGIRFDGWTGHREPDRFWHPFGAPPSLEGTRFDALWGAFGEELGLGDFDRACFEATTVAEAGRAPAPECPFPWAQHLDATKLGGLLRREAEALGVVCIEGHVEDVAVDGQRITSLRLRDQPERQLTADLYIDCTGFSRRLLGQALGVPFQSWSEHLWCDRAVVASTPREALDDLPPHTTATALDSGWLWRIPLRSRDSWGYVYSSRHADAEAAIATAQAHLPAPTDFREIACPPGRMAQFRVGNCVAIGLAGGFIEPLESSGLFLVERGIRALTDHLDNVEGYNRAMVGLYEELYAFLVAHYAFSRRTDSPFWRDNAARTSLPARLEERMADFDGSTLAEQNYSWVLILAGLGRPVHRVVRGAPSRERIVEAFAELAARAARYAAEWPSHRERLAALDGSDR